MTSTPTSRDLAGIRTCNRSAEILSSGATSTSTSCAAAVLHQPEQARDEGQGRTLKAGKDDHKDQYDIEQELRACDALGQGDRGKHDGYGAAQPRPGEEGLMPYGNLEPHRAGSHRGGSGHKGEEKPPATTAISAARTVTRSGNASRPSITKSPICAIQPIPSTNERVAARCGSWTFPKISAQTYTAANPLAWMSEVMPYANTVQTKIASG